MFFFYRVENPLEKRVRRWGISMEELVSDPTGELWHLNVFFLIPLILRRYLPTLSFFRFARIH